MSRLAVGEEFWAFDPEVDRPGSMLEAVELLSYWRDRGLRFTVAGLTLQIQEPAALSGKLLTSVDVEELTRCERHIRSLLLLEAQGEYNLGLVTEEPRALQDLPQPPTV